MERNAKIDADQQNETAADEQRRKFLKKSVYAAYATPVILSLLVENANACKSWNPGHGSTGHKPPKHGWGSWPWDNSPNHHGNDWDDKPNHHANPWDNGSWHSNNGWNDRSGWNGYSWNDRDNNGKGKWR